MRRPLLALLIAALAAMGLGACSDDEPVVQAVGDDKPTKVAVEAKEYAFTMPAEITADVVELQVENTGKEAHMAGVTKLAGGKTMADLQKGDPSALSFVAGVPSMDAGLTGNATFEIQAGDYLMVCFLPGPDGQPNLAKGMIQPFTVKASPDDADLPTADLRLEAKDFSYSPAPVPKVKAGETTVRLTNVGPQDHEITVVELQPGKTPADIGAFFANPVGPPPFSFQGGIAVRIGASGTTTVDFDKGGNYAFVCLIPDPADGQLHLAKGMVATVTVT